MHDPYILGQNSFQRAHLLWIVLTRTCTSAAAAAATEAGTGVVVLTNADNVHDAFCAGGASAVEQALFTLAKTL